MIAASACLLGACCRHDGENSRLLCPPLLLEMYQNGEVFPVCPEALGGLLTPRPTAEILCGDGGAALDGTARVINKDGMDVTEAFLAGAKKTLEVCLDKGVSFVVLKSKSPSCGVGLLCDGTFCKRLRSGDGVTAALLKRNGIKCVTEEDFPFQGRALEPAEESSEITTGG